jgi:hypothetical protein
MGYISWSSFQWIIIINCSKVLKNMPYNAQTDKPTAPMASERPKTPVWALSAPQIGQKTKKLGLLEVPPSSLLSLHLQNVPMLFEPGSHAF